MKHDVRAVSESFAFPGDYVAAGPYGTGHINDTYCVTQNQAGTPVRYIIQRINDAVFKNPVAVMENIQRVTRHQHAMLCEDGGREDRSRRALTLVPTRDGRDYHVDAAGGTWRAYLFIERATTYDQVQRVDQAGQAARAFGLFMKQLRSLPGAPLHVTIPGFHDTRARFDALQRVIGADPCNRAAGIKDAIDFAQAREGMVDVLLDLQRQGRLPEVVTHNDTKLNNVMLDDVTGEGVCVIDLDTVMPGLSLYDFGDMVRTAACPTAEDEQDVSKVVARGDMIQALVEGYLEAAGDVLNGDELAHLVFAGRLITLEIGIRFLTDYLEGDVYFKTRRPGQNADRCRCQFAMVRSLESQQDDLESMVAGIVRGGGGA
jgi:Ser/Thr protein kinase RdoA (MazF antagonist)